MTISSFSNSKKRPAELRAAGRATLLDIRGVHIICRCHFKENTDLIPLLEEMSLLDGRDAEGEVVVKEQFLCREPEERLFYLGRWYEGLYLRVGASEEDLRQFDEFQKLIDGLGQLARCQRPSGIFSAA